MPDVLVVCTARGQHKPVKVASFACVDQGDAWRVSLGYGVGDPANDPRAPERIQYDFDAPGHPLQLRCPRCRLTVRHKLAEWTRAAAALATRAVPTVDMSCLPPKMASF